MKLFYKMLSNSKDFVVCYLYLKQLLACKSYRYILNFPKMNPCQKLPVYFSQALLNWVKLITAYLSGNTFTV